METQTGNDLVNLSRDSQIKNEEMDHDEETEVMEIDLRQTKHSIKNDKEMTPEGDDKCDDEEEGDEPDAMNMSQKDVEKLRDYSDEKKKLHNGYTTAATECPSEADDVEEDNRLVIDDVGEEALSKSLMKSSGQITQDHFYSCPKCDVVTISAKAYLYHLDTVHKATDKANGNGFRSLDSKVMSDSIHLNKTNDNNNSDYLNLSIPLTDQSSSMVVDDGDEDGNEGQQESNQLSLSLNSLNSSSMQITTDNIDKIFDDDKKKKKKTRQEVDPGKYFEAVDSSGTKYACSQCGNIYKWRKSLNKHWKEKHLHDTLVEVASPPGMLELLKSGKYTQLGSRRIYDNTFLATIKTQKDDTNHSLRSTPNSLPNSPSPPLYLNSSQMLTSNAAAAARLVASIGPALQPKMIGPFVANGTQPVFPGMGLAVPHLPLQNGYESTTEEGALDLTRDSKAENSYSPFSSSTGNQDLNSSFDQDQPLDFSKKKEETVPIKHEKLWEEMSSSLKHSRGINQYIPKMHRCSKCDYTSTSESDFAAHTGSHYNKRIVKCFECKIQLNSMEELNSHFSKDHNKKLTEYKEAIKKIPHGLQQTYHLLKMDLQSIGELNNQDMGSSETKSLKCKKCDFEAKWPAELQKHAVSHSEERPYICMVCGSTYKWKWDLVKHFQKSHPILPNPYRRNDKRDTPDASSEEEIENEPESKKPKLESSVRNLYNTDDAISVEGIIAATQAGQRFVSSQPTLMDSEYEQNLAMIRNYSYIGGGGSSGTANLSMTPELLAARHSKAQKALQEAVKHRQNGSSMNNFTVEDLCASPGGKNEQLPYKCTMCNYHARWPSEVTQHMKNHSDSKPYLCPRCDYRSKWKWDVVKHLKRCGGGSINDVIDTTKVKKKDLSNCGPPNAIVSQHGKVKRMTPQPLSFIQSIDCNGQPGAVVFHHSSDDSGSASSLVNAGDMDQSQREDTNSDPNNDSNNQSGDMDLIDLTTSNNNNNNNDDNRMDNNINNNYAAYTSGQPTTIPSSSSSLASLSMNSTTDSISNTSRNTSPAPSAPMTVTTPSSSSARQNSSAENWNCRKCSFTTQSQAELKRHSGVHQDDKPFKCDECHYSTRWACDLKKHRKSYDHYPKRNNALIANGSKEINRNFMEQGPQQMNDDKSMRAVETKARFKCFQCSLYFVSLLELMEHRKSSHSEKDQSNNSPTPETMKNQEIDAARIKHPRKQIKQISCSKCPFLCKNRQTMDLHMEEHEQMEKNALHCFYCSDQFQDKETLLDHIISHPSFNPKEWETFFMVSEEDEPQQQREEINEEEVEKSNPVHTAASASSDSNNKKDIESKNSDDAATQARIQQILNEIPKQKNAITAVAAAVSPQSSATGFNKFKCEWCPAEFINLTSVYKHASQAHPIQLKEQDNSMSLAYANLQNKSHDSSTPKSSKTDSTEALESLKQQIADKRQQQLTEKIHHVVSTNYKVQEVLNRRLEEDKLGGKKYQCDKCNFSSPSRLTFQRHYELHGGSHSTQCWFCDYRMDRMELLYHHMKISHTRKWKSLSQDPLYASQIQRMNLAFANTSSGNNNDSPPGPSPVTTSISNSTSGLTPGSTSGSTPGSTSGSTPSEGAAAMDLSSKRSSADMGHDIMYATRLQYTWSGVPVNVVPSKDQSLKFGCPICTFTDASIGNTCTHVMQSHSAMPKFQCKRCDFSEDNIHIMSDHCKTSHPVSDRFVEVLDFKQLSITDIQMIQLNYMKENLPHLISNVKKTAAQGGEDNQTAATTKHLSCPFCPFQSHTKQNMKQHIVHHNSDSRFRCEQCDFSVDSPSVMSDHVKVHSANYKVEDNRSIKSEINIKQEQDSQSERRAKGSSSENTRKEKDPMDASMSNSDFTKSISPKSKTSGRIRYRCSICPYHTTCKSNIFKHKRQHNIPKRYKCTHCSYSAARAVLLRNHIESHSVPVEDDGYFHDIFYDPNISLNEKIGDGEDVENDIEEGDDESSTSDDLESEMDTKAIADLEAKDIMEAEAAFKASSLVEDSVSGENTLDRQCRKQKCFHCPFSSNSVYEFRKHVNFHGTQERYKCDHCNYSIDRLNLLTQHRKLHSDEPSFSLNPMASNLLNTSFILQQNELAVHSYDEVNSGQEAEGDSYTARQFSCSFCPYKVSSKNSFDIHKSSHEQRKRYICDFCDWSVDRFALLSHHRKVHENEPSYDANPESQTFLNKEFDDGASGEFEAKFMEIPNLSKPAKDGENESAKSPPFKLTVTKKSYPCKLCPYKTNSKSSYQFHKNMHGGGNSHFQCTKCDFSAINGGILQQHILLHSMPSAADPSQKPRPLSHSDQNETGDSTKSKMGNELTKGGNASDFSYNVNSSMKASHIAELTCDRCPFIASSSSTLREHVKSHSVHEKLMCPYCDFGAVSREIMFPHIQIHFPGTKLESSAMDRMLEEHAGKHNNNNNNNNDNNNANNNNNSESSTVNLSKTFMTVASPESTPVKDSQVIKTKIYVCQYCEREFEAKSLMIQHEKQHLVGSPME